MQQIIKTIEEYHMIEPGCRVVAGVSGGADSVCLLYALKTYKKRVPFELYVVHVEHGIRGEESLQDAVFVKELCTEWGVPWEVHPADVCEIAKERGISLEEAGRAKRYEIFSDACKRLSCNRIAVAHNENDQAETVLHNLVRGSGLKGMGGIRPIRSISEDADDMCKIKIIRPLLFTERREIENILKKENISWRTDRTNLETDYTRNRIRLSLLPQMEAQLNAQAVQHIAQAGKRLQEVQNFLTEYVDQIAEKVLSDRTNREICICLSEFTKQKKLIQKELLRKAIIEQGGSLKDIGSIHIESLMQLADMDCGRSVDLPEGRYAVREDGIIRITNRQNKANENLDTEAEYPLPMAGSCQIGAWKIQTEIFDYDPKLLAEIREEKKYTKFLSYDTIKNSVLRTRRTGDFLVVNEQGGKKKLKDYLINCKIPRDKRDQLLLLAEGSHVFWVSGCRISEAAKVNENTTKVIKIQMEEIK